MTVIVTRLAPGRVRGFLASCMCEIAPGVYTAPRLNASARDRVWKVIARWHEAQDTGPEDAWSAVMTWQDSGRAGGQAVRTLGTPRSDLVEKDGIYLAVRKQAPTTPVR